MASVPLTELPRLYREAARRLTQLVSEASEQEQARQVAACPAWSVRELLAHVVGVVEDTLAGRLVGPPTSEETAAQVARYAGLSVRELVERFEVASPSIEPLLSDRRSWPLFLDLLAHEHDVRGALERPASRDSRAVWLASERLVRWLRPAVGLRLVLEDGEHLLGPAGDRVLTLQTTRFEAFRWRLGRRSRAQLLAMDWSADPTVLLDALCVFGPSLNDIFE